MAHTTMGTCNGIHAYMDHTTMGTCYGIHSYMAHTTIHSQGLTQLVVAKCHNYCSGIRDGLVQL